MGRGAASAAAVLLACAACGGGPSSRPPSDRQWVGNARGSLAQLRYDIVLAAGIDPERAVREDASIYEALVAFTDFAGCTHMVRAFGDQPARRAKARAAFDRACGHLERAAELFTAAERTSDPGTMRAAIAAAQRAFAPLDDAELALRRE